MKLLKIFFVLFLCVWLFATEGCKKCFALYPCSVRARFVSLETKKGFSKCVCINRFYGKNCRFKDYILFSQKEPPKGNGFLENKAQDDAWKLDASWHYRSALIKVRLGGFDEKNDKVVKYRLTYRRVHYFEDEMRNGKWEKLTNFSFNHTRPLLKSPKIKIYKILLSNASSYEINLSTFFESGRVTSTSAFLDSWNIARSGYNKLKTSAILEPLSLSTIPVLANAKWLEWGPWSRCKFHFPEACRNGTQVRKRQCDGNICPGDKVEQRPCEPVTICSASFFHVTGMFKRKGPNCFQNGIIIGGSGGSVCTLVLFVVVYIIIRRCKSAFHKKRSDLVELENPAFDENEESSEFELESVNTTSSIKKENNHSPNGSGFVSITIPDCSDKDPVMIEAEACSTNKDNEVDAFYCSASVAITIAEDKNVITVDTPVQLASSFIVEIPETMLSNGSPSETDSSKLALVPCLSHASQPVETPQGNTLTSEEEPESVIVKIEETADNDDMTVLSASMSSDESSTTSSSSVEAARAVLVTIGTGDQTPAELK